MSEELALDELARNGRAIDLHERRVLARREPVDGAADELLARTALTSDEHAGLGGRHLVDVFEEPLHGRALADHLVARFDLLAQPLHRRGELGGADDVLDADDDALAAERLLEEVGRAELDGGHGVMDGRVSADDDDRHLAGGLVFA